MYNNGRCPFHPLTISLYLIVSLFPLLSSKLLNKKNKINTKPFKFRSVVKTKALFFRLIRFSIFALDFRYSLKFQQILKNIAQRQFLT